MSLAPDTRIGTYEILAKLSEGGVDGDGSPDGKQLALVRRVLTTDVVMLKGVR